jgi:hypothetical protein
VFSQSSYAHCKKLKGLGVGYVFEEFLEVTFGCFEILVEVNAVGCVFGSGVQIHCKPFILQYRGFVIEILFAAPAGAFVKIEMIILPALGVPK